MTNLTTSRHLSTRPHPDDLHMLLQGYRLAARTEGKSPKSVTMTAMVVRMFVRFLTGEGCSTAAHNVTTTEIRAFILYLQDLPAYQVHPHNRPRQKPLSGHAVNTYLRSLRAFFGWLVNEGLLPDTPFFRLRIPRPPRKVIPAFTPDQIKALLRRPEARTHDGCRDRAMMVLMLDTGIRVSELTGLGLDELLLEEGIMKVFGKGAKERIVPLGNRARRELWRYLRQYRPEPASTGVQQVFLRQSGVPLTPTYVEVVIKRYGEQAGLRGVRCSPHTFRHTFAISYLRNGGDVFSLQAILGHSGLDIVKHYVNLARVDIVTAHKRFSPADNMRFDRWG